MKKSNGGVVTFLTKGWKHLRYERWTASGRGVSNCLHMFKLGRVKFGFGWVPKSPE